MVARKVTAKFRYSAALPTGAGVALCGAVLGGLTTRWYLAPIMLIPLAVVVWGVRAGVDVRDGRLIVRWGFGHRRLDPGRIRGFTITHRAVRAVLDDGSTVWLPSVPGTRVPVLAEVVGLRLATDPPPADRAGHDDAVSGTDRPGADGSGDDRGGAEQPTAEPGRTV